MHKIIRCQRLNYAQCIYKVFETYTLYIQIILNSKNKNFLQMKVVEANDDNEL